MLGFVLNQPCPKVSHLNVVKRIFKYLKDIFDIGLWYPKNISFDRLSFSDADFASCLTKEIALVAHVIF